MSQEVKICGDCTKHQGGHCIGEDGYVLSYRPWYALLRGECSAKTVHLEMQEKDTQ